MSDDTRQVVSSTRELSGRVALVTGGGTGIGAGIARAFADGGAHVAVIGRRSNVLADTVAAIDREGGRALAITCDVTALDELIGAVDETVRTLGRLDMVVANAGGPPPWGPVLEMDPSDWRRTIDVNLTGVWNTAYASSPRLIESGGGHILVMGSCAGRSRHGEMVGAYSAAKAGVSQLTRVLAFELREHNIAVNELTPGLTATEGIGAVDAESRAGLEQTASRMGDWFKEPAEIGRLARYIVSLPTSGTSGQTFSLERNR
jgi:3-oxoacyl-[acyl-carrier protein] reductase